MSRDAKFDGDWLDVSTQKYLNAHGYAASVIRDGDVRCYCLHRASSTGGKYPSLRYPIIFETKDLDELNRMIKLLVPEET